MRTPLGILLTTLATAAATVAALPAQADRDRGPDRELRWQQTVVDAEQSFRGLDAVDRRTAWVSGGSISGGDGSVWRWQVQGARLWRDPSWGGGGDTNGVTSPRPEVDVFFDAERGQERVRVGAKVLVI